MADQILEVVVGEMPRASSHTVDDGPVTKHRRCAAVPFAGAIA
jgi:hypothetical protein